MIATIGGALPNLAQEEAQKAQVLRLPETFEADGHGFWQAWRSSSVAVYLRDCPGGETHKYFTWAIRTIGGVEMIGELIKQSPSLDVCIHAAARYENQ